jgi:hypothetical protein
MFSQLIYGIKDLILIGVDETYAKRNMFLNYFFKFECAVFVI